MTFHYRDGGVEDMSQYVVEYGEKIKHNDLSSNLSRGRVLSSRSGQCRHHHLGALFVVKTEGQNRGEAQGGWLAGWLNTILFPS